MNLIFPIALVSFAVFRTYQVYKQRKVWGSVIYRIQLTGCGIMLFASLALFAVELNLVMK